ncbi:MAG TPA: hypothetical protein VFL92_12795 [Sphingomonas sp.]|nr:hypothetical protein [Sphingomonas sp.]
MLDYDCPPANSEDDYTLTRLSCHLTGVSLLTQVYEANAFNMRFVYSFTPEDEERFIQKTRIYVRDIVDPEVMERLCRPFVDRFKYEVEQDFRVLDYKRHLPSPRLCAGDGPIMKYRRYAEKYYALL